MKIFVVYASAGAGHQKAAEAVYEYLQKTRPDLELRLIDILDYTEPLFKFIYSKGYIFLISRFPWLWYLFYLLSFIWSNNPFRAYGEYRSNLTFINLIKTENPQLIISTHFITSNIISIAKKKGLFNPELLTIITDYNLHPFWIGEGVDIYVVASSSMKQVLIEKKVKDDKIRIYGIPVGYKFYLKEDRKAVSKKLNISDSEFTVLIMTGTIGIGPIEQIVKTLVGSVQLLVVCGNNAGLYRRLSKLKLKGVFVYPLVDNINELMSVSDIVLTKAGGLTIAEALAKKLPMIFFSSIPGLETANADAICKYGAAFRAEVVQRIKDLTLLLKRDRCAYQEILDKIIQLRKIDTLQMISSEIPIR